MKKNKKKDDTINVTNFSSASESSVNIYVSELSLIEIVKYCILVYLASRLIIGFEYAAINNSLHNDAGLVSNLWRWDSGLFSDVVQNGYNSSFDGQSSNWPFFPMWVIILKVFSLNGYFYIPLVGVILNQIFLFCSLILFTKILITYKFSTSDVKTGVFLLAIAPANIYYCSGLSESLFLLLSLYAFYSLQMNRIYHYLLAGALLSATRMVGVCFILPMLYHLYQTQQLNIKKIFLYSAACASGLLMFMLYMKIHTGYTFAFLYVQDKIPSWVRPGLIWDSSVIEQMITVATTTSHIYDRTIFAFSLFIVTSILFYKKFTKEAIFNLALVIPGLVSGNMWNAFRFDTSNFVLYLAILAVITKSSLHKNITISIFSIMSFICWLYWLSGSYYFA